MSGGKSSISKAETLEEMGEFWDTHDFTEYDTDAPDVLFDTSTNARILRSEESVNEYLHGDY